MAFNANSTVTGLTTLTVGIPIAGPYVVSGKLQLPNQTEGDPSSSQVVVTITQTPSGGGPTTIYTGLAGARGFSVIAQCAALDAIAVSMTSAAAVDQAINAIKSTISVG